MLIDKIGQDRGQQSKAQAGEAEGDLLHSEKPMQTSSRHDFYLKNGAMIAVEFFLIRDNCCTSQEMPFSLRVSLISASSNSIFRNRRSI
jgi:hypothetical protein